MSGFGTRIVLRGQKPLALCDRCPCFGSLFPPLAALTFAASSIICAFGLASAAPRSPYRHLELCGIAQELYFAAQTIADTAELYWDKPDTAGAEAEYHLFVDDERMAVMNPLDAGRFAAGAFLLRQALR